MLSEGKRPRLSDLPKAYLETQVVDRVCHSYREADHDHELPYGEVELFCYHLRVKDQAGYKLTLKYYSQQIDVAFKIQTNC